MENWDISKWEINDGSEEIMVFGEIKTRNGQFRIMYNNVNGLKVNDFLKSKVRKKYEKKKNKMLQSTKSIEKMTGVLATIRKWDANVLCLAESQCAWENYYVREKLQEELRECDQYAGFIGSSSCVACGDSYKPGGTLTVYDGNWSSRMKKRSRQT